MLVLTEVTVVVLAVDSTPASITVSVVAGLQATHGQGRQALASPANLPFSVVTEAENAALDPL